MCVFEQDLQELPGNTSASLFGIEKLLKLPFSIQNNLYSFKQAAA